MNASLPMNRRRVLQTTGFLTVAFSFPFDPAPAQQAAALPSHLKANPLLSSWLRINADKTVTLFIGKVELGQGALTALSQICADELGVDFDRLNLISGDTALSPNQGTTSGSQTMSDGGTAVQAAAAEVREILFGLAAARLGQSASTMTVADGTITAANGRTTTYWDLVTGEELHRNAKGGVHQRPLSEHRYIGKPRSRVDIPAKITGRAIFIQDMNPDGVVFGAIVRPPAYTAKLLQADTAAIEKIAGVIKVLRNGSFLGIVAEREDQAFAAAKALAANAKWDVESGLPGTEGIFDWLTTTPSDEKVFLDKARATGGPPAKVMEATYYRPYHMHGSIGTSTAIARLGDDGVMTIHTHSQNVFGLAGAVAELLGVDQAKVLVPEEAVVAGNRGEQRRRLHRHFGSSRGAVDHADEIRPGIGGIGLRGRQRSDRARREAEDADLRGIDMPFPRAGMYQADRRLCVRDGIRAIVRAHRLALLEGATDRLFERGEAVGQRERAIFDDEHAHALLVEPARDVEAFIVHREKLEAAARNEQHRRRNGICRQRTRPA